MTITKSQVDKSITLALSGRLDTNTAPELESALKPLFEQLQTLVFDFAELEYISSAGLRVLLATQKKINSANEQMRICHVNDEILEVFTITGMRDIFTIE